MRRVAGVTLTIGWIAGLAMAGWAGCSSPKVRDELDGGGGGGGGGATDGAVLEDARGPGPIDDDDDEPPPREGGCAEVEGECDVVLQDCPDDANGAKQECVVTNAQGAFATRCAPVSASQQLPIGRACCPGADNPCLPGLTCVGEPCADGGPMSGRCSPACCDGDHASCGQSEPEGIRGRCDVALYSDETQLHHVCSYRERCKPFGIEPCRAGQVCLMEDQAGTSSCIHSSGKGLREPCTFANDCADGLYCAGSDGARTCRMICLRPGSTPPFDASALDGGPGFGGCPPGEACEGPSYSNMPAWFQICALPDGG